MKEMELSARDLLNQFTDILFFISETFVRLRYRHTFMTGLPWKANCSMNDDVSLNAK